jgi:hypothetical protein
MGSTAPRRTARELAACTLETAAAEDRAFGVTAMDYHIIEARHVRDYVVWLKFRDGTAGEIDLGPELRGPVFEPLRTQETFRSFRIDPEFHTLVWPNGADFAPEFLHDSVKVTA